MNDLYQLSELLSVDVCGFLKSKRGTGKQGCQHNDVCAKCPLVWGALGKWRRRGYGRWQSPASEKIKINKK